MAGKSILESNINNDKLRRKIPTLSNKIDRSRDSNSKQDSLEASASEKKLDNSQKESGSAGGSFGKLAGQASNFIPYAKQAKMLYEVAKKTRRVMIAFTLIPWICLCCFIVFGLYQVKRTLDDPFANITTIIKATSCSLSTDPNCVTKVFFDKTVEYVTEVSNED